MHISKFRFAATFIMLFVIVGNSLSQERPQKVYRIVYIQKSNDWYKGQAKLWKLELEKNSKNAESWLNYYLATAYSFLGQPDEKSKPYLRKILNQMKNTVPESFEHYYLKHRFDEKDILSLEKAYELKPDNPEVYYGMIVHHKLNHREQEATMFLKKLYQSKDIATGIVNYNYNVLMSLEENAILFTNGDNDTYPAWMLQAVKDIRKDITILNISLTFAHKSYLKSLLEINGISLDKNDLEFTDKSELVNKLCKIISLKYPDIPIYLAVTLNKKHYDSFVDKLYVTGLAYKYDEGSKLDNLALLYKNVETHFRLDYLNYDWYSESHISTEAFVKFVNTNYVTPFLLLAEHLRKSGVNERSKYWRDFALDIAKKAGKDKFVKYMEENY